MPLESQPPKSPEQVIFIRIQAICHYFWNNIAKGIRRLSRQNETGLAGVICNSSGNEAFEKRVISEFAEKLGTQLIDFIPHSPAIQANE